MPEAKLMTSDSQIKCTFGTQITTVSSMITKDITINGKVLLSQIDCIPEVNLKGFGLCRCGNNNPKPCQPNGVWIDACEVISFNDLAPLSSESYMVCANGGGLITFVEADK